MSDSGGPAFNVARPTPQMAFACENISQDPAGRLTFVNLIDVLSAASFPTTTIQLFIVFGFIGQLAGFIVKPKVLIEDEQGQKVVEAPLKDMALTADAPVARAIVGLQGIQWPRPGRYLVKFVGNGDKNVMASFPLSLVQAPLAGVPGGPGGVQS